MFQQLTSLISRWRPHNRPLPITKASWESGISEEVTFWREWFQASGGQWHEDYTFRMDPDSPLQSHVTQVLDHPIGATVNILDVGAGPLTYLGKRWVGRTVHITAVDPLANEYDQIMSAHAIVPPVRTELGAGETLTERFAENTFDLVHARNCIDHSKDPALTIQQMVAVAKVGGLVYMHHAVNEAETEAYHGFHQWNLYDSDGDLCVGNKTSTINVTKLLGDSAIVTNQLFDNDIWIITTIRKLA